MKQYYYFLLFSMFLFSCERPKEQILEISDIFSFEIVDSLDGESSE